MKKPRPRRNWIFPTIFAGLAAIILAALLVFLSGLEDFELSKFETRELSFQDERHQISGSLILPVEHPTSLVLLIHGDGPADRFANGGYLPLINALLDGGIAVFCWDKPGIGKSEGHWLQYSLAERARLVEAALIALAAEEDLSEVRKGVLGLSQGGWVVADLAAGKTSADFAIIIGGAVNWLRQGQYYQRRRLENDGATQSEIETALSKSAAANNQMADKDFDYQDYLEFAGPDPMSSSRFQFVRKNMLADSSGHLTKITIPVLTLHGGEDLNVDPDYNSSRYRFLLKSGHAANRSSVIKGGTHSLLRAELFNYQLESQMPWWSQAAFLALGRYAYAPEALDLLTTWTRQHASSRTGN
ncbi:alpha/beta fold hydrolase [uncultured Roseibium sp.]|uniref:alpha/beta hydrolase family protein n=1 Tax=uncultured Roseibium sp. TaxID=1936171 RepID=UPI00263145D9|nr:alpha/beta fold hydrolase [uncultured Roseibium sp.]